MTPAVVATPGPQTASGVAATPRDGDTTAVGIVRLRNPSPVPEFVLSAPPPGGADVALEGALHDELGALVGLEIRVRGRPVAHEPSPPARSVLVSSYDIVSVAGRSPVVGVLGVVGDTLILGDTRLLGAPDALRHAIGAKVWVLGSAHDGRLAVESYGIIRRP